MESLTALADPFTIRFRLLMKNLFDKEFPLLWDDAIPDQEKKAWIHLISEAVHGGEQVFPRSTRPDKPIEGPRVTGFGDGAFPAYGGCVYLVCEHGCSDPGGCSSEHCQGEADGHYTAHLALAKGRVTPLCGFTIPRSEMSVNAPSALWRLVPASLNLSSIIGELRYWRTWLLLLSIVRWSQFIGLLVLIILLIF